MTIWPSDEIFLAYSESQAEPCAAQPCSGMGHKDGCVTALEFTAQGDGQWRWLQSISLLMPFG